MKKKSVYFGVFLSASRLFAVEKCSLPEGSVKGTRDRTTTLVRTCLGVSVQSVTVLGLRTVLSLELS